ncbi:hypothetical protein B0T25DRAFT_586665 [Lasiosphaeria hispida]|uniref:Tyrosinase copper-binding domain-containing protein n=1 Tax=Lasiosphaeria hispida TaxID=260671 RepID=A0AAJ0HTC4_9PEZI|nr:hypothetical protein B0T25DRAFT_586665 [Lasiosphaeria hispida]
MAIATGTRTWLVLVLLLGSSALGIATSKDYLNAVECILAKPSKTPTFNNTGVISRYDLVYTHIQQTFSIHYTGHFMAWHRFFGAVYENMLRNECDYKGAQPYWDWTLDTPANKWANSPVFDGQTGFSGNGAYVAGDPSNPFEVPGRTGGGCVPDGPFAGNDNLVDLGPSGSVTYNPQCLRRDLGPYFAARYLAKNQTQLTLAQPDFGWFARTVEGGPSFEASGVHGDEHYGVDPIFYLHHANLDRLRWSWQKPSLAARLADVSGSIFLMDYDNVQGGNVTLGFPLKVGVNAPDVTVRNVMNIGDSGTGLCYEYDKLSSFQFVYTVPVRFSVIVEAGMFCGIVEFYGVVRCAC